MERYKEKIPLDTCVVKSIVKSIENADYLYQNYMQEEKFPTDNGSGGGKMELYQQRSKRRYGRRKISN